MATRGDRTATIRPPRGVFSKGCRGLGRLSGLPPRVREELGVTPPVGRLLAVDRAPNEAEGDKVLYLFDGGRLSQDHNETAPVYLEPSDEAARKGPWNERRTAAVMDAAV
ncbi:hypothetical protein ACFV2U_14400 [Streptomyces sp. NPDC059697]|uniref:hypothetical protein n=1 Tax=Streptomyces sp. NPDC059697 TaxID=3346912 RepID=UPI003679FAF4